MGMIGSAESTSIMQLMSNLHMDSKGWTHLLQKRRRARLKEHRVRYYAVDKVSWKQELDLVKIL